MSFAIRQNTLQDNVNTINILTNVDCLEFPNTLLTDLYAILLFVA